MRQLLITKMQHVINVSEEEQQFIIQIFKEKHAVKNDYFLREGDVCKEVGFIVNGLVRYFVRKDDGEEMIYDFGKENNFICNYESFLDHSPSQKIYSLLKTPHGLLFHLMICNYFIKRWWKAKSLAELSANKYLLMRCIKSHLYTLIHLNNATSNL